MPKWIPCGSDFVTGDVLRWLEAVWKPKARKYEKARKIGARMITAQVMTCGPEWAELKVIACETAIEPGWTVENYASEEVLRRRRGPMARNGAERRLWSDESARSLVASRFRGPGAEEGSLASAEASAGKTRGIPSRTRQGRSFRRRKGPRLRPGSH